MKNKNNLLRSLLLIAIVALVAAFNYPNKEFNVSTTESIVNWVGKKVTGEHNGTINLAKGNLVVEKNVVKGGSFEIDMNSIICLDIKNETYNTKLVDHLKSDDFFSTEKHPVATFVITEIKPKKAGDDKTNYSIKGDLTIKGITKPLEFPAIISLKNDVVTAKAEFKIDRSKFDVRFGSKSFFEDIGDKMIYDDFEIALELVAKNSPEKAVN